ncbi:MAG: polysaccharide deacetylase family protein [Arenicella sp.]|nr:polysaccharide deacetylase family protein [Arenicella sp.]
MKLSILLCLFLSILSLESVVQSVAFSFDDGLDPTREPRASKWNASILDSLSKNKVKAIFYVTGGQMLARTYMDTSQMASQVKPKSAR